MNNKLDSIKVSIVLPVYNAVNYIRTTINSVLSQTYNNFELIIIDDGATDGTSEICEEYSKQFSNIIYVKQKNEGTCAARNRGIKMATGDYITFLDHDDEYLQEFLNKMVKYAIMYDLDVVKCGVFFEEAFQNSTGKTRIEKFKKSVFSREKLLSMYNDLPISFFAVWNSLYKTSVIQNIIEFPKEVRHGQEDYFFNTKLIPQIKNIGFIDKCLYKHYRRISQSTSAKFYEDRVDHMALYFRCECDTLRPLIEKNWEIYYAKLYARKITGVLSYIFSTLKDCDAADAKKYIVKYLNSAPYEEKITFRVWLSMIRHKPKYAVVLVLVLKKKYDMLIKLWRIKNV